MLLNVCLNAYCRVESQLSVKEVNWKGEGCWEIQTTLLLSRLTVSSSCFCCQHWMAMNSHWDAAEMLEGKRVIWNQFSQGKSSIHPSIMFNHLSVQHRGGLEPIPAKSSNDAYLCLHYCLSQRKAKSPRWEQTSWFDAWDIQPLPPQDNVTPQVW